VNLPSEGCSRAAPLVRRESMVGWRTFFFCQVRRVAEQQRGLVRTIGRWSLAALMLNTMIGASIFGLPSLIAARAGSG